MWERCTLYPRFLTLNVEDAPSIVKSSSGSYIPVSFLLLQDFLSGKVLRKAPETQKKVFCLEFPFNFLELTDAFYTKLVTEKS